MSATTDSSVNGRVGVVIVNFNSGPYLERCLRSLLPSDIPLDIVVVDNNSSDSSMEAVSALDTGTHTLCTVSNPRNVGFSAAVNVGRGYLKGETLMLLNPDCVVHPHTVRKLNSALEDNRNAGLAGPLVFSEDGTEQRGCRRNEPTLRRSVVTALGLRRWASRLEGVDQTGLPLPSSSIAIDAVSGSCLIMPTRLFDALGGMDESYFLHCEDLDLCRRVRDAGRDVMFVPGVSIIHRQGGSSGAGFRRVEMLKHRGMLKYYRQHHANKQAGSVSFSLISIGLLVWSHFLMALVLHVVKRIRDCWRPAVNNDVLPIALHHMDLVVTGANSDVGDALLEELGRQSKNVLAVSRQRNKRSSGKATTTRWLSSDFFNLAPEDDLPRLESWIHLAPIWSTGRFQSLISRSGVRRVVGLSSSSVIAKAQVADEEEQRVVRDLKQGEDQLVELAESNGCAWAILRPTLIYGGRRNRNINRVRQMIQMTGHFFVIGDARGRRQPVHARDVAQACLELLDHPSVTGFYNLPGGETLGYRDMVGRVFQAMGRRPRIITIPDKLAMQLLMIVSKLPGLSAYSPQLASRMSLDQDFDAQPAIDAFGYQPQPFTP